MLYFCSEETAEVAGIGSKALAAYQKANKAKKMPKRTVFDNRAVVDALKKSGLKLLAKVPASKENKETWMKYKAGLDTMLIVAPNGQTLAKYYGNTLKQAPLTKSLKTFKRSFEEWKKTQGSQKK